MGSISVFRRLLAKLNIRNWEYYCYTTLLQGQLLLLAPPSKKRQLILAWEQSWLLNGILQIIIITATGKFSTDWFRLLISNRHRKIGGSLTSKKIACIIEIWRNLIRSWILRDITNKSARAFILHATFYVFSRKIIYNQSH